MAECEVNNSSSLSVCLANWPVCGLWLLEALLGGESEKQGKVSRAVTVPVRFCSNRLNLVVCGSLKESSVCSLDSCWCARTPVIDGS